MPLPQPVDVSPRAGRFRRKAPEIPQTDAILEGLIGEPNAQNMRIPCEAAALGGYMGFDLPPAFRLRSANRLADRVFGLGTISLEARQSRCGLFRVVEKLACVIRSQSRTGGPSGVMNIHRLPICSSRKRPVARPIQAARPAVLSCSSASPASRLSRRAECSVNRT